MREVETDISTREDCWRWGTRLSRRTVAFGRPRDPGAASPATGRHAEREEGRVDWEGSWNECGHESLDPAPPRPTSSPPPPAHCSVGAGSPPVPGRLAISTAQGRSARHMEVKETLVTDVLEAPVCAVRRLNSQGWMLRKVTKAAVEGLRGAGLGGGGMGKVVWCGVGRVV